VIDGKEVSENISDGDDDDDDDNDDDDNDDDDDEPETHSRDKTRVIPPIKDNEVKTT